MIREPAGYSTLRIVVYLLLWRLFTYDLFVAHDAWTWVTVAADVLLGVILVYDARRRDLPLEQRR